MKTILKIPIEIIQLLPFDRPYTEIEMILKIVYDRETQTPFTENGYADMFQCSRTKVRRLLERYNDTKVHTKPSHSKGTHTLEYRKNSFGKRLIPYLDNYTKELIREFYDYWTESMGNKLRFEGQYFDIGRRLAYWKKRSHEMNGGMDKVQKEADSLLQYAKTIVYPMTNEGLIKFIQNSKKSDEVKKYCLEKI